MSIGRGISAADPHAGVLPGFLDGQLDRDFEGKVNKARRPDPQENLIIRKRVAVPIERHARDAGQGLFFSGDPFGAIFLSAIISQSRKTIIQPGHPAARSVMGGGEAA